MRRHFALMTVVVLGFIPLAPASAQPPGEAFQGYWMGIDPLDGGDSRRSIVQQKDGTFAMAGRDTRLTLCDGTDHGIGTFDDGVLVCRRTMRTDKLALRCFNTGDVVLLLARYHLISDDVMVEVQTTQEGTFVTRIVFHKVSQD